MNKNSNFFERIMQIIDYYGIKSINDFALNWLNYTSSEKINRLKKENTNPSFEILNDISNKFVLINSEWLITGNGPMLRTENSDHLCIELSQNCTAGTPIYDIDVTCGREIRDFRDEDIIGYINIPSIRKDSKIVFATGDSMFPKITDGDRIVIREIESWDYFNYGQMYLILTPEYRMLKYIRKHPKSKDLILLKSENSNYDDIELKMSEIVKLFIVENILSIKSL